jgi:hypothetical protein
MLPDTACRTQLGLRFFGDMRLSAAFCDYRPGTPIQPRVHKSIITINNSRNSQ